MSDAADRHGLRVLRQCLLGLAVGSAIMTTYRVFAGPVAVFRFFLILTLTVAFIVWGLEPAARIAKRRR